MKIPQKRGVFCPFIPRFLRVFLKYRQAKGGGGRGRDVRDVRDDFIISHGFFLHFCGNFGGFEASVQDVQDKTTLLINYFVYIVYI